MAAQPIVIVIAAVLVQCYATRTDTRCLSFSFYETYRECQAAAREYRRVDSRALLAANAPIVVSYHCKEVK